MNVNSSNSRKVHIMFDFKDLKESFQLRGIWCTWFPYFCVYLGRSGLFFYHSDTLVSSSCRSIQTWVFAWYSEDAIVKFTLKYTFTKLWSPFLKEELIIKFQCLWILSHCIFIYVLYHVFFIYIFIFFNSYFIIIIIFVIIVSPCELMQLITIGLTTILAANLNL